MSKFEYKAEGELNSQYLLDLLKEYLTNILQANDTKNIAEDEYKINPNASRFSRWFNNKVAKFKYKGNSKNILDNYNKVLSTKYANAINDKIDIYLQTNVLDSRKIFELKNTLQAIKFDKVLPLIDVNRENAIQSSQKKLLKVLKDVEYLKDAKSCYILYNSPVAELKPFLSDKVSEHNVNVTELQNLIKHYLNLHYTELNDFNFEPFEYNFTAKEEDFYTDKVTDNGVGEEVEEFIRSKMLEKLNITKQQEVLIEDQKRQMIPIDNLLKKLKLTKIEKMMYALIELKTNQAHVKEVVDSCKDTINSSTIDNKAQIFLVMDSLYYKLSKECEDLQAKIKQKLQLVDKQKMFATIEMLNNPKPSKNKKNQYEDLNYVGDTNIPKRATEDNLTDDFSDDEEIKTTMSKPGITENLYDDDDGEIHISEDDDGDAEEEFVIDDENFVIDEDDDF